MDYTYMKVLNDKDIFSDPRSPDEILLSRNAKTVKFSGKALDMFNSAQAKLSQNKTLSKEENDLCIEVLRDRNDVSITNGSFFIRCVQFFKRNNDSKFIEKAKEFWKSFFTPVHRQFFRSDAISILEKIQSQEAISFIEFLRYNKDDETIKGLENEF